MKNVILLTVDAMRKDVAGCYGSKNGLTPFLDSLADKSLLFTRAQSTGPYTQASFPGILTSSYYLDYGKPAGLAPQRTLVSEPLKDAGITTAAFHSNPYLCAFLGWNRGWDVFYDSMEDKVDEKTPYVRGQVVNDKAVTWLSSHVEGDYNPFFLWMHYMDIHEPYIPQRHYLDMIDPLITLSEEEMFSLFQNVLLKRDVSDLETVKLLKTLYDAHVREVDDYLKELFASLESLGVLADTTVIITHDHGDEFGEHGGLSHDDRFYSELIDMPLLIHQPERTEAEFCHNLVSNIDIPPTIIRLFGLKPVKAFVGSSLLPIEAYPEKGVFGEAIEQQSQRGGDIERDSYFYRENDLKLMYRADLDTWEMYDLATDPEERNSIISSFDDAVRLKAILKPRVRRWER